MLAFVRLAFLSLLASSVSATSSALRNDTCVNASLPLLPINSSFFQSRSFFPNISCWQTNGTGLVQTRVGFDGERAAACVAYTDTTTLIRSFGALSATDLDQMRMGGSSFFRDFNIFNVSTCLSESYCNFPNFDIASGCSPFVEFSSPLCKVGTSVATSVAPSPASIACYLSLPGGNLTVVTIASARYCLSESVRCNSDDVKLLNSPCLGLRVNTTRRVFSFASEKYGESLNTLLPASIFSTFRSKNVIRCSTSLCNSPFSDSPPCGPVGVVKGAIAISALPDSSFTTSSGNLTATAVENILKALSYGIKTTDCSNCTVAITRIHESATGRLVLSSSARRRLVGSLTVTYSVSGAVSGVAAVARVNPSTISSAITLSLSTAYPGMVVTMIDLASPSPSPSSLPSNIDKEDYFNLGPFPLWSVVALVILAALVLVGAVFGVYEKCRRLTQLLPLPKTVTLQTKEKTPTSTSPKTVTLQTKEKTLTSTSTSIAHPTSATLPTEGLSLFVPTLNIRNVDHNDSIYSLNFDHVEHNV